MEDGVDAPMCRKCCLLFIYWIIETLFFLPLYGQAYLLAIALLDFFGLAKPGHCARQGCLSSHQTHVFHSLYLSWPLTWRGCCLNKSNSFYPKPASNIIVSSEDA